MKKVFKNESKGVETEKLLKKKLSQFFFAEYEKMLHRGQKTCMFDSKIDS